MTEVNKEHLHLAAVIAAGLIQTGPQDSKKNHENSYKAVQDAVHRIEQGQ